MGGENSSKRPRDDPPGGSPVRKKARGAAPNIANSRYADERKNLLKLVQKLDAAGARQYLAAVPRVVVIGNQSAGKSSVVEAISGITVPRDAGTCTRCPMECRMSSYHGNWSCQISIRMQYDERVNKKLDKTTPPALFGDVITDKGEVELALRRAQFAVLNPELEHKRVLFMSHDQLKNGLPGALKPLDFSRNVVCIDIWGPDMTDLAFIDLPGLIQVHDNSALVILVENLVVDYIKEENSLILVTIPMTDDLENQKALTLARRADVHGTRTIGVLTKADALPPGSRARENWLEVIEGRKKELRHGYYCTRQPDDAEREQGVDHPTARANETKFFETHDPWAKSTHKSHFGIQNLVRKIGPLLQRVIRDSLPGLQEETRRQLEECDSSLADLPPAIDKDVFALMLELVAQLSSDMTEFVKGSQGNEELTQKCRHSYKQFKVSIRATAPRFDPCLRGEKPKSHTPTKVPAPAVAPVSSAAPCGSQPPTPLLTPQPSTTVDDGYDLDDDSDEEDMLVAKSAAAKGVMNLDDMHAHIEKSLSRELPGDVPLSAKQALIAKFQSEWEKAALTCLNSVRERTQEMLYSLLKAHFGRWEFLRGHIRDALDALVQQLCLNAWHTIAAILEAERTPTTQNVHYFQTSQDFWLSRYRSQRGLRPKANLDLEKVQEILAGLVGLGFHGLDIDDLQRLNAPDEYEREMVVMAYVRGYFKVAFKRVIDIIPMLIDLKFLKELAKQLQPHLLEALNVGGDDVRDRFERYFSEDEDIITRRKELTQRKETLEIVKAELNRFTV